MLSAILALGLFSFPPPSCMNAYGKTVCGYDCVAQYGQVRCARTPAGACLAAYGKVRCFDPPLVAFAAHCGQAPKAMCIAKYDDIACGYGCVVQYGEVRCARTPMGVCHASRGKIECFDPPLE